MNDIYVTLTGNVAAEPRQYSFDEGTKVTSLRVLTSHRYFDRKTGQWTDGEKVCFTVRCWRALGDNVAASIRAGQPVVVSGKLRIREFGAEGDRRFVPEIEASAVGHDLRWGTGVFTKPERGGGLGSMSKEMRERLDEETRDWSMGARPLRPSSRPEPTPQAGTSATTTPSKSDAADTFTQPEEHTAGAFAQREEHTAAAFAQREEHTAAAFAQPKDDTVRILGAETEPPNGEEDSDDEDRPLKLEERAAA